MLINTHPSKVYVPPTRNMPDRIEKRNPILGSFKGKDAAIINLHQIAVQIKCILYIV